MRSKAATIGGALFMAGTLAACGGGGDPREDGGFFATLAGVNGGYDEALDEKRAALETAGAGPKAQERVAAAQSQLAIDEARLDNLNHTITTLETETQRLRAQLQATQARANADAGELERLQRRLRDAEGQIRLLEDERDASLRERAEPPLNAPSLLAPLSPSGRDI